MEIYDAGDFDGEATESGDGVRDVLEADADGLKKRFFMVSLD